MSGAEMGGQRQPPPGFCAVMEDFYDPQARGLIGQLVRSFLDQSTITVLELLHSGKQQLRLDGAGTLLRDTIERAAKMQAAAAQMPLGQRMRDLDALVSKFGHETRELEKNETLPAMKSADEFLGLCGQLRAGASQEQARQRIFRLLTEYLGQARMWYEKAGKLIELADRAKGSQEMWYIDCLIGECLISDSAQEALLGRRSSIENRVDDFIQLYKGAFAGRGELLPVTARLNLLLLDQPMDETRAAIETAIVQQLAFRDQYSSPELLLELRALHALLAKLKIGDKVLGGRRALEFIDKRMGRLLTQETISDYVRGSQGIADRLGQLLDMYAVTFGPQNRAMVESFISRYFGDQDFERRLTQGEGSPQHKLKTMTNLYRRLVQVPMAAPDKAALAGKLVRIQAAYLNETKLFANIEKQTISSAKKCQQIIALCLDHHFMPGENLDKARALVRHYLARPDFVEKHVDGVPDRAAAMAGLKKQLETLGIQPPFQI